MTQLTLVNILVGEKNYKFAGTEAQSMLKAGIKPGRTWRQVAGSLGNISNEEKDIMNNHYLKPNYFDNLKQDLASSKACFVTVNHIAY